MKPNMSHVRAACASVEDPEFGVGVDDLGLIYNVTLHDTVVVVEMTLTTPSCPASDVILNAVRAAVERVAGVTAVDMRLVWDPGWTPEMVTLRGRQQLGWT